MWSKYIEPIKAAGRPLTAEEVMKLAGPPVPAWKHGIGPEGPAYMRLMTLVRNGDLIRVGDAFWFPNWPHTPSPSRKPKKPKENNHVD